MAEHAENIYGNQEIIRKHAGDPKPTKVCRPEGLGQESIEHYEEEVYVNREVLNESHVKPVTKTRHVRHGNYEVLNGQQEAKAVSYHASQESPPLYEGFNEERSATNTSPNRTKWEDGSDTNVLKNRGPHTRERGVRTQGQETFELQEVKSGVVSSLTTPISQETNEKVLIKKASRYPFFLGAIAIVLALIALAMALLFGLRLIKVDDGCSCQRDDTVLQAQVDRLQKEINDLRKDLYLRKSEIANSSILPTAPPLGSSLTPTASLRSSSVTPTTTHRGSLTSRLEMSFEISTTLSVAKGILSTPNKSSPTTSFSVTSSADNSSEFLHSTVI